MIKCLVIEQLPSGGISEDEAAALALKVSTRTLQRRLREGGAVVVPPEWVQVRELV